MLKIELHEVCSHRVAGAFFRVAGEMRRLLAYFDNPVHTKTLLYKTKMHTESFIWKV